MFEGFEINSRIGETKEVVVIVLGEENDKRFTIGNLFDFCSFVGMCKVELEGVLKKYFLNTKIFYANLF